MCPPPKERAGLPLHSIPHLQGSSMHASCLTGPYKRVTLLACIRKAAPSETSAANSAPHPNTPGWCMAWGHPPLKGSPLPVSSACPSMYGSMCSPLQHGWVVQGMGLPTPQRSPLPVCPACPSMYGSVAHEPDVLPIPTRLGRARHGVTRPSGVSPASHPSLPQPETST